MKPQPFLRSVLLPVAAGVLFLAAVVASTAQDKDDDLPPAAKRDVDFAKDVQPLFAKYCLHCHGDKMQEGGLRLNQKKSALAGGDSGPAILPGKSSESRMVRYVTGKNPDATIMPPETEGVRLSDEEVGLLRAWIDRGAKWPERAGGAATTADAKKHWAFQPIARVAPPAVRNSDWVRTPIDAFVLARLEALGIAPSPEADKQTLIRRLSLDLTGLPPSPEEVGAFVADNSPDAYERLVDRLLASPNYGERWARHWLDLARYADSDGYEKDTGRPHAWRFRHWVVKALNDDMPFDRFTIEQLAGDLLPDRTIDQLAAAGFHRNTLTNKEGGIDPEEDRVKQTVDRTNTTGMVWLGLTVGCAQCHTHKYDPIAQREYYGLYAFFNSLAETDVPAPLSGNDEEYLLAKKAFDDEQAKLRAVVEGFVAEKLPARQLEWEKTLGDARGTEWHVLKPVSAISTYRATLTIQEDGSVLASGTSPPEDVYTIVLETELSGITAIRLETLADPSLPSSGPGRVAHGNFVLSELKLTASPIAPDAKAEPVALQNASADFAQGKDGKEFPPSAALDGNKKTGWAVAPQFGRDHVAVFETAADVAVEGGVRLTLTLGQHHGLTHTIGRLRIAATTSPRPVRAADIPNAVRGALAIEPAKRTPEQIAAVLKYYRTIDPEVAKIEAIVGEHAKKAPVRKDPSMAQAFAEMSTPRQTHLLIRGDFLQPGQPVEPCTPEILPPLKPAGPRPTRLDLARWLVDAEHPLTSRVTVNRVWQQFFGQGLVESSHDFGTQGTPPSHPELLDWLAREFTRNGWSLKSLHRAIVTSAVYRQSSATRTDLAERDPYNKLLARQNRLRVEAEVVRDLALSASGLLETRIGGPSVRPPQPEDFASLAYAGAVKWENSKGADRYRRGLYTFFQRTVPYPMLVDFDAPDGNLACTRRERSNTPLSALTLQNDPVFVECAQALARRLFRDAPGHGNENCDRAGRVNRAFQLVLGRGPLQDERGAIIRLHEESLNYFAGHGDEAGKLIGPAPKPDEATDADLAAYVVVARTLLNLDEFITRE
ncbi:MAG: PSD1 domain-containing protein [Planctomycetia bacterium]|nr:PSD1 domain-containing protein [Planctomycetia bacterium]